MPQISKCRIVNFWYNDGKRLIADELYNFSETNSDKVQNIYIDMENGIGKTVLLQLMLQPVIPRAKVADRRIEDFFNRSNYHSYILLEWRLDNSQEKLLTGISIASSDSMEQDTEEIRGRNIKYYTFVTGYRGYDKYSIESMELSRPEKGHFVPESFDYVRSLAKSSRGRLEYYSSDDSKSWKEKLAQYGIIQNEWKSIMETLNQKEGGISSYFESFKKSDQIIDGLMIPAIEGKFGERRSKEEDNSLETMLIQYARQYSQQQSVLEERAVSEKLAADLENFNELLNTLWETKDCFEKAKSSYYAFYLKLGEKEKELKALLNFLEEEEQHIQIQIHDIKVEEQSFRYYSAVDKKTSLDEQISKAKDQLAAADAEKAEARKLQQIMECARLYKEILTADASLKALQTQLKSLQEDADTNQEMLILQVSLKAQLDVHIPECQDKLEKLVKSIENKSQELNITQEEKKELGFRSEKEHSILDQLKGRQEVYRRTVDELVEKLDIHSNRLFFASYPLEDFTNAKLEKEKELSDLLKQECDKQNRKEFIQDRLDKIPEERASVQIVISGKKEEQKKLERDLEKFRECSETLDAICLQYSMEKDSRYSGALIAYLKEQLLANEKEIRLLEQQEGLLQQQKNAVQNGTLHILKEITDFLDEAGVEYQPCERYLLNLVNNRSITVDKCALLLETAPSIAFAIVVADRERFLKEIPGEWLPAAVPVYTYKEINGILAEQFPEERSLALYSAEYFQNPENYLNKIEEELVDCQSRLDETKKHRATVGRHIALAEKFKYAREWEANTIAAIEKVVAEISGKREEIVTLSREQDSLKNEIMIFEECIRNIQNRISAGNLWIQQYDNLINSVENEIKNQEAIDKQELEVNRIDNSLSSVQKKIELLSVQIKEISCANDETQKLLNEMSYSMEMLGDVPESNGSVPLITEKWQKLSSQYIEMLQLQDAETKDVWKQIEAAQKKKEELEAQMQNERIGLQLSDYDERSYSSQIKKEAREKEDELDKKLRQINEYLSDLKSDLKGQEIIIEQAEEEVRKLHAFFIPREQVGSAFEERIADLVVKHQNNTDQKTNEEKKYRNISKIHDRVEDRIGKAQISQPLPEIILDLQMLDKQRQELDSFYSDCEKQLAKADRGMRGKLDELTVMYKDSYTHFQEFFRNLQVLVNSEGKGDHYYSMIEQVDGVTHSIEKRIHQITSDLEDFDRSKIDLINHCSIQGKKIYDGLRKLEKNSQIQIYEGKRKTQMFCFRSLPKVIDESIARRSIENEIDQGIQLLVKQMENKDIDERNLRRYAQRIVGSPNLIRKYIQADHIQMEAYKVDKNVENARYRSWENTQVQNSGAQKFLVFFSIIVAIIAYNRNEANISMNQEQTSVLILDNPFGPITSAYALKPMFKLARLLKVQMICLSNISKSDITVCFDKVIKVVLKTQPLSSIEMISHDEDEVIEHGFYSSEQLSFDFFKE